MAEIYKIINNKKLYIRHCSECCSEITYTFATEFYKARKRNFLCKECSDSNPIRKRKINDSMKGIKRLEEIKKKMSAAKKDINGQKEIKNF